MPLPKDELGAYSVDETIYSHIVPKHVRSRPLDLISKHAGSCSSADCAMTRIAFIVSADAWGGTEVHTLAWARSLVGRGYQVTVAALTGEAFAYYSKAVPTNIELVQLHLPKAIRALSWREWRSVLGSCNWDVAVMVKSYFGAGTLALDLAARSVFRNFLAIEHLTGNPLPTMTSRRHFGIVPGLGLWWHKLRFSNFGRSLGPQHVICVSEGVRRRLTEYLFPSRKLRAVHNGIDVERFRFSHELRAQWRDQLHIGTNTLVFGAIGRLNRMKGYDVAIECFKKLLDRNPGVDAALVLVGSGDLREALISQAGDLNAAGHIKVLPFTSKPWEVLCGMDVFLMPSRNEGLPLSLLEAMACERCAVAADVGGVAEVVSSPELGWLVPAHESESFLQAMQEVLDFGAEKRVIMGKLARRHVETNFRAEVQFDKLTDIIESICPCRV